MELVQNHGDKGRRLVAVVRIDPGQHVAVPARRKAAIHRIIEAVVFFARVSEFDPIAAWRQSRFYEPAPARELLQRPIGRSAVLDVITDPERAGLREHADDRFIDVLRRIKARGDDAELHRTNPTSNGHRTLDPESRPDGAGYALRAFVMAFEAADQWCSLRASHRPIARSVRGCIIGREQA